MVVAYSNHRCPSSNHSTWVYSNSSEAKVHSSSCRVGNGTQPPHRSIFHFRNVVFARSLTKMCTARLNMFEIACDSAAHLVFALPVATCFAARVAACPEPTRVAVGRARHGSEWPLGSRYFGSLSYIFRLLSVAHPTVLTTSRHGIMWAYTGEPRMLKRNCCESVGSYSRAGGNRCCFAGLWVGWCARCDCGSCALFLVGDARQHVDIGPTRGLE